MYDSNFPPLKTNLVLCSNKQVKPSFTNYQPRGPQFKSNNHLETLKPENCLPHKNNNFYYLCSNLTKTRNLSSQQGEEPILPRTSWWLGWFGTEGSQTSQEI